AKIGKLESYECAREIDFYFPFATFIRCGIALLFIFFFCVSQAHAEETNDNRLSGVQALLYAGRLAEAEKAAQAWPAPLPSNQTARFALASIHFFQAVEGLGRGFFKYGLRSAWTDPSGGMSGVPFLRLPVPRNPNPERAKYENIRQVLIDFYNRLQS